MATRETAPIVLRWTERGLEPRSRLAASAAKPLPRLERLNEVLKYDSSTGIFVWRVSRGTKMSGRSAGNKFKDGYVRVGIDGQLYAAHRLAWLMHYGCEPPLDAHVDHINNVRSDNRISNLRIANPAQNKCNSLTRSDNKAGIKGVRLRHNRWEARIFINKRHISIGWFLTAEEARAAYAKRASEAFGEFARCDEA